MKTPVRKNDAKPALVDLFPDLEIMLQKAEHVVMRDAAGLRELRLMADYLIQMRVVLSQLKHANAPERNVHASRFDDLEQRFFSLEGRIKDMLNDRTA
jgi:hypothetical protein